MAKLTVQPVGRDAGNAASSATLARSISGAKAILLSVRSNRNADLAHRGRSQKVQRRYQNANAEANPGLYRLACKMATGAGKTTVMAMIIAWQAVNKARRPDSKKFSDAFLIVTPGITIRDRLRSAQSRRPKQHLRVFDLVPSDLMDAVRRARIVITNYHSFMLREKEQVSKLNRQILGGREGEKRFTETEGET